VAEIHGCFGHDVLAFVALTDPQLFEYESGAVRVAVDGLAQGLTDDGRLMVNHEGSAVIVAAGDVIHATI